MGSRTWRYSYNREERGIQAVGLKEPNAWGLFDMNDNVWEWCEDRSEVGSSERVYRRGGWRNHASCLAESYRDYASPFYRSEYLGFRLAVSQD